METIQKVGSVSNSHLNQKSSPSQDTGLVSKDGYERISSLTLYVPENIDIDRLLFENPPNFRYERDCFVYILYLISSIPARKRDIIEKNNGYTPINKKFLQKRIHEYKKYIDYLKTQGIVEENRQYKPGKSSMGLKFSERYNSKLVPINITKWTLIKSIIHLELASNLSPNHKLNHIPMNS